MKQCILSVTLADCRVDAYRGSGKGGQKRNKTSSAIRITHPPSGAVGNSEDGRNQIQNKKTAFGRMARSKEMQTWLRMEAARRTGETQRIKEKIDRECRTKTKIETRENGTWVEYEGE